MPSWSCMVYHVARDDTLKYLSLTRFVLSHGQTDGKVSHRVKAHGHASVYTGNSAFLGVLNSSFLGVLNSSFLGVLTSQQLAERSSGTDLLRHIELV